MPAADPAPADAPAAPALAARRWRWFYLALGYICVGLAIAGAVLPVLPTTPFLIVAVWAYMRSHPQRAERLLAHPRFGPLLRDWREQGAIPTRAKIMAISLMAASWGLVYVTSASRPLVPWIVGLTLCATGLFILTRPAPRRAPAARPEPGTRQP